MFIALLFMPLSILAQIDYNYSQIDRISTQYPIKKIMWLKSAQSKQSLSFYHFLFFVNESNIEDIVGDNVILNIYHNNKIIHTKELTTISKAPNSIYLISPIKLKPKDSVYLIFNLKQKPDSTQSSYLISIKDRTKLLKDDPQQYRELIKNEVNYTHQYHNPSIQHKHQYQTPKNPFGETYDQTKTQKNKKSQNNGWIHLLAFLTGL